MKDGNKTKAQLIAEINKMRLRVHELEEANKRHIQTTETLHASEDNLRITLHSIGDAVIATDINGRITRMNPVAEQLTGWTDKEAKGKQLKEIFRIINEESRRKVENPVEKVLREGIVVGLANHTLLIAKDGREIPIADSGAPIKNDDGQITGVVLVFRDQTKERAMQRKNAMLATIIENSDDAIIGKTLAGIITSWNNAAQRMYGYSAEEATGKSISIIIPPERREEMTRILTAIGSGKKIEHFETVRMKKNGENISVSVTVSPIKDREGKIIGASSIVRDITERKKMENAMRKSEEKYRGLYNSIRDAILIADTHRNIIDCNTAFTSLFGYTRDEITGQQTVLVYENEAEFDELGKALKEHYGDSSFLQTVNYRKKTGEVFPGETSVFYLKNDKGEVAGFIGLIRDITERKQALEALHHERDRAQKYFDIAGVILVVLNDKGEVNLINKKGTEVLGYEREKIVGKNWFDNFLPAGTKKQTKTVFKKLMAGKIEPVEYYENSVLAKSGEERIIAWHNTILQDEKGNIVGTLSSGEDITERKRMETKLLESEERFRLAFHTNPDSIALSRLSDGSYIDVNRGFCRITGYTREEVIGRSALEMNIWHDPNDRKRLVEQLQKEGVVNNLEVNFRMKNGKVIIGLLSAVVMQIEKEEVLLSIARDITDRKRMEKMRNAQYNINRAMVTAADINTLFEVVRNEVADLINVKNFIFALYDEKTDLLRTTFQMDEKDTIPPFWKAEKSLTGQVIKLKKSILLKKNEINQWIKKGEIEKLGTIPEVWLGIPLLAGEAVVGAIVLQDYDEPDSFDETTVRMLEMIAREMGNYISHRQMEVARERLSAAIEQAAEVVVITDTQGTIEYVNPAFERLTGYSRREAIGQNPRILKSGEHDEAFYRHLWETISVGKIWQGRFINRRKDLTVFTEEATISPVFDNAGKIVNYVAVKRDITKELELEQRYQQAQKMESIGRLAGGVAHDFNNLLTVINGYATLIMNDLNKNDPIYTDIKEILKAGERAGRLTQQLLAFSRKQIFKLENFCLNEIINDLNKMLRRLLGEDIRIDIILQEDLTNIRADLGQVEQVIINMAINARDAMPNGGNLTIETRNVTLDKEYAATRPQVAPGNYVLLAISDTGEGMDKETQSHIFEPFFTTKGSGKGTGLGLATVYGILKQSGGFIWVYSEIGKGTTFKIYFPVAGEAKTDQKPQEKPARSLKGNETILLIEDEDGVRRLALRALEEKGYRVLVAKNGGEALLICEEYSEPIDLVVTDVVMPHMSGKQFVAKISKTRPEIKVIYTSGYTDNVIVYHGILDKDINFIHKPFSPDTLLHEVRKVLDADQ